MEVQTHYVIGISISFRACICLMIPLRLHDDSCAPLSLIRQTITDDKNNALGNNVLLPILSVEHTAPTSIFFYKGMRRHTAAQNNRIAQRPD